MNRSAGIDRRRLEALLGGEELAWLRDRVRQRVEQGGTVSGVVRLGDPSPAQRAAVDRLMGRRPSSGRHVSASLDALDRLLREAQVCDGLVAAVAELDGPVRNRRAERRQRDAAWARVVRQAADAAEAAGGQDAPWMRRWLDELVETGLLRRLAGDAAAGGLLLAQAQTVLAALPGDGATTAGLAAHTLGDSHSLDDGRPLTTLVLKGIQHRGGIADPGRLPQGEERRALWATVGVLGDELSSTVLALGLHGSQSVGGSTLTEETLRLHAQAGEPIRLTLSQLLRQPAAFDRLAGATVFVCENPAVVAAAAQRLAATCAPLVCVEGQPSAAAQTLLRALAGAGARLAYHGDFDWPGLRIGQLVMDRFGAAPWRFATTDYLHAPDGPPLRGRPARAAWAHDLADAMAARGTAVHEEQVLDALLTDLTATSPSAWASPGSGRA